MLNNLIFSAIILLIVILCISGLKKKTEYNLTISLDTSLCLKGVAAVLVAMHHIQIEGVLVKYYMIFGYIGFCLVGLFFFLSGYGLVYGYCNKKNYLQDFLYKHLLSIFIPYWLVQVITYVVSMCNGDKIDGYKFILGMMGFGKIWFVTAIVLFYIFFYISFGFIKKIRYKIIILSIFILIYMSVCRYVGVISSYTASSACFVLGIVYYLYKEQYFFIFYKKEMIWGSVFAILFVGRLYIALRGLDNELFHMLFRNIISCAFVLFVMSILSRFDFHNRIGIQLGKMSYELFLVHMALLPIIHKANLLIYLIIVIFSSYALYHIKTLGNKNASIK